MSLSTPTTCSAFTCHLVIGKIEHMEKFGLSHNDNNREEESSVSGLGKAALLAGALVAAGAAYENHNDAVEGESAHSIEAIAGLPARESVPLEAFYAVDEYKEILGETWDLRSVPGSDSEQDRMQASLALKHGVSVVDFKNAFEYKLHDAGLE